MCTYEFSVLSLSLPLCWTGFIKSSMNRTIHSFSLLMLKRPLQRHWLHFTLMIWEWLHWTNTHTHTHCHPVSYSEHAVQFVTNMHPRTYTVDFACCACEVAGLGPVTWSEPEFTTSCPTVWQEVLSALFCHHLFLSAVRFNGTHTLKHTGRFCQTFYRYIYIMLALL